MERRGGTSFRPGRACPRQTKSHSAWTTPPESPDNEEPAPSRLPVQPACPAHTRHYFTSRSPSPSTSSPTAEWRVALALADQQQPTRRRGKAALEAPPRASFRGLTELPPKCYGFASIRLTWRCATATKSPAPRSWLVWACASTRRQGGRRLRRDSPRSLAGGQVLRGLRRPPGGSSGSTTTSCQPAPCRCRR